MAVTTTSLAVKDGANTSQSLATQTDPAGVEAYAVTLDRPGIASYRASILFTWPSPPRPKWWSSRGAPRRQFASPT
jgi:hypothetical protein